jgi:hypothetical protein
VLSTTYQNAWLDALLGSSRAAAMPATVYAHLYTDDPDLGGVELASDGGYAPPALANDDAHFPPAADGEKTSVDIDWVFTGAASDTALWCVFSDGTDLIIGGPLSTACVVGAAGGTFTDSLSLIFPDTP